MSDSSQPGDSLGSFPSGDSPNPTQLQPLLRRSWHLLRKHIWLLAALELTISLPMSLLECRFMSHENQAVLPMLIQMLASTIVASILSSLCTAALSSSWAGHTPGYLSAWRAVVQHAEAILAATLLSTPLILAGALLCLLPGMFFAVKLFFAYCFIMDAGQSGTQALMSSWRLTDRHFWPILGNTLFAAVVTSLPFMLQSLLFVSTAESRQHWIAQGVLGAIFSLPMIFLTVFTFVLYKSLRFEKPAAPAGTDIPPAPDSPA